MVAKWRTFAPRVAPPLPRWWIVHNIAAQGRVGCVRAMRYAVAIIVSLAVVVGAAGFAGWRDGGISGTSQVRISAPSHQVRSREYWRYLPVLR